MTTEANEIIQAEAATERKRARKLTDEEAAWWREGRPNRKYFDEHWRELRKEYPGKLIVIVRGGEVHAFDTTEEESEFLANLDPAERWRSFRFPGGRISRISRVTSFRRGSP